MSSKVKAYALMALCALLGAAVVFVVGAGGDESRTPDVGKVTVQTRSGGSETMMDEGEPAPNFSATTLDGESFRLDEHAGQVVVLNFWATWCAPCRVEIPDLIEMQLELGDEDVRFVGISVDHEGEDVIRAFAEEAGINYPIVVDEGAISDKYGGVYALPTTFVIDREGLIRMRKPGLVRKDALMPVLQELVAG